MLVFAWWILQFTCITGMPLMFIGSLPIGSFLSFIFFDRDTKVSFSYIVDFFSYWRNYLYM